MSYCESEGQCVCSLTADKDVFYKDFPHGARITTTTTPPPQKAIRTIITATIQLIININRQQ